ncbi:MAG: hypothetical protein H6891_08880 [Brucellaceae bacterium]|nr:hypothetical protein [Brucellaceae bacterium]
MHGAHAAAGRWLTGIEIDEFNKLGKDIARHMPDFSLSKRLFIQFKRPTYLTSRGAKEWSDWSAKLLPLRETTPHQQEALERIDAQSYGRAINGLCQSGILAGRDDLWKHVRKTPLLTTAI